ncbi:hypothetical protein C8F04DRAFT_639334 [Mycena alexandri]|uniref:Uncharacterized protein n=1 Tax=Mycena alexandri TaxID=1745969 RepID=A0AAD6SUX4_9AGAR|nr:hypothetical protein C8F04DRAFT_639334 [Mycena alexandri]
MTPTSTLAQMRKPTLGTPTPRKATLERKGTAGEENTTSAAVAGLTPSRTAPKRKLTRRETREMRELVSLLGMAPAPSSLAPVSSATLISAAAPLPAGTARGVVATGEEEEDELVPTRPNTPDAATHAHSPVDDYAHYSAVADRPLVTTRRIYEAARTSPTQVRAWRTEVGALDVDVGVDVDLRGFESRGAPGGEEDEVVVGSKEQGEGEERKLKRAGTDGEVRVGRRKQTLAQNSPVVDAARERDSEEKGTHRARKRASLPIPLEQLRLGLGLGFGQHGRGRGRREGSVGSVQPQEEVDPWTPTSRSQSKIRGKNKSQSRQRRTTVTRARAVSVAVRPAGVGVGDGHGAGKEREKENTGLTPAIPTAAVPVAAPTSNAPGARPSLRLAVPHKGGDTDGRRTSWLEEDGEERECESPAPVWVCQGWNCRDPEHGHALGGEEERAEVISLASCKDYQLTWEDKDGGSMTRELVRILERDPHPTLRTLVTNVSHALHRMTLERHLEIRRYKRDLKRYNRWFQRHRPDVPVPRGGAVDTSAPREAALPSPSVSVSATSTLSLATPSGATSVSRSSSVIPPPPPALSSAPFAARTQVHKPLKPQAKAKSEGFVDAPVYDMDNFQNPQVASHLPLDMERPWSM